MTLISIIRQILSRKETKYFIICSTAGGVLQFLCSRYIKNHPEFLEEPEISIEIKDSSGKVERITQEQTAKITEELAKEPIVRRIIRKLRGGQLSEKFIEIFLRILFKKFVKLCAAEGGKIGVGVGAGLVLKQIPKKSIAKLLEGAIPQNLLDKKGFMLINGEKIYFENCDNGLKYLFSILMDKDVPYTDKKELVTYVFRTHLDMSDPIKVILCLLPIFIALSIQNPSSYFLLLKGLIQAIKEGKISKRVARLIVRKLLKRGTAVDPELLDLIQE